MKYKPARYKKTGPAARLQAGSLCSKSTNNIQIWPGTTASSETRYIFPALCKRRFFFYLKYQ